MFVSRIIHNRPFKAISSLVITGTLVLGSFTPAQANSGPTTPPPALTEPIGSAADSSLARPVFPGDIPQPVAAEPEPSSGAPQTEPSRNAGRGNKIPNQIIVKFKDRAAFFNDRDHRRVGQVLDESPDMLGRLLKVPDVPAAITALQRNPHVEFVEENMVFEPAWDPNDTNYYKQWHLKAYPGSNLRGAWDVTGGNANNRVVIVDTGVDSSHPDLVGKQLQGWNFANNSAQWGDCQGHGTLVAGVAAAVTNNGAGVAGADVYGKMYVAKVTGCDGNTTNYLMGKAMGESSAWTGAKVINVSHRTFTTVDLAWIDWGVKVARSRGVVVVAAAGNDNGRSALVYPAASPGVIGVAATDGAGKRAGFSNIGPYNVDLAAPGVDICTTAMVSQNSYSCPQGTSFSSPLVAGIATLVRARYPNDSVDMIEARLKNASWNPDCGKWNCYTNGYGAGIVQANYAVR